MKPETSKKLFGGEVANNHYKILSIVEGPNDSSLTFVSIGGHVAIIQDYADDNGFDVYDIVPGNSIDATRQALGIDERDETNCHYFASSALHWSTHKNLLECLQWQKKRDTRKGAAYKSESCNLWRVPLPPGTEYRIDNFAPLVEGAEFIARIVY